MDAPKSGFGKWPQRRRERGRSPPSVCRSRWSILAIHSLINDGFHALATTRRGKQYSPSSVRCIRWAIRLQETRSSVACHQMSWIFLHVSASSSERHSRQLTRHILAEAQGCIAKLIKIVCPPDHHFFTLRKMLCTIVSSPIWVTH